MDICSDLQDGHLDGSYTAAQWQAFSSDPTVQGYCSVIVPPCVNGVPTAPTVPSCTQPCVEATAGATTGGTAGAQTCTSECPPGTTSGATTGGTTAVCTTPVPLTPTPTVTPPPTPQLAGVAGAEHTVVATPTKTKPAAGVKGVQHTATAPTRSAVSPAAKVSGTLPFTGVRLAVFSIVGIILIAMGLLLRASTRTRFDA